MNVYYSNDVILLRNGFMTFRNDDDNFSANSANEKSRKGMTIFGNVHIQDQVFFQTLSGIFVNNFECHDTINGS